MILTQLKQAGEPVAVHVAMVNLLNICNLLLFSLMTASLAMFLSKCMEKGMIFRFYYNWITYWLRLSKKEVISGFSSYIPSGKSLDKLAEMKGLEVVLDYFAQLNEQLKDKIIFVPNKYIWLWKPLGGCIYCFGTWVFVLFYCLTLVEYSFLGLFLGMGLNYLWIEVIQKIKK